MPVLFQGTDGKQWENPFRILPFLLRAVPMFYGKECNWHENTKLSEKMERKFLKQSDEMKNFSNAQVGQNG